MKTSIRCNAALHGAWAQLRCDPSCNVRFASNAVFRLAACLQSILFRWLHCPPSPDVISLQRLSSSPCRLLHITCGPYRLLRSLRHGSTPSLSCTLHPFETQPTTCSMDAVSASMSPPADNSPLFPFVPLVLAFVIWIIVVSIILPRFLGRIVSFFINRAKGDTLRIVIRSIYIYPLAGRAVAHSVRYTVPNGTIAVEELILQIRWWRKSPKVNFNHLLTVEQPATLDRVAHAQQESEKENTAIFLKRFLYRLRRWWRRMTASPDLDASDEPTPLISVICVGLRTRMVNYQSNYNLVKRVLHMSRNESRLASLVNYGVRSRDPPSPDSDNAGPVRSSSSALSDESSSAASFSSVQSVDEKPFVERLLELTSLRITHGAFYFFDIGESPLVRISVNSAKLRYMYGAPACALDKCRKRIRMRTSGLKISVSDESSVKSVTDSSHSSKGSAQKSDGSESTVSKDNSTNRLIQRVLDHGYRGISEPEPLSDAGTDRKHSSMQSADQNVLPNGNRKIALSTLQEKGWRLKRTVRRTKPLPCSEVLHADTAIIDYVFDEPGVEIAPAEEVVVRDDDNGEQTSVDVREDSNSNTPPVCRVSVLLRGTSLSYNAQAFADIERVVERLQPPFYDLVPVAKRLYTREGKREATGIQIAIDASPVVSKQNQLPLLSIPFDARESTWNALKLKGIRQWSSPDSNGRKENQGKVSCFPMRSKMEIHATKISLRTEIPYEYGASQKTVITLKDVEARVEGVVNMPIGHTQTTTITRIEHTPKVWNEVHAVSFDVVMSEMELNYFPDTLRIIDDIGAYSRKHSKKPENVRYFVPYRETVKIRAENDYCVVLACSHDNAWKDIQNGVSDQYGKIKVCGRSCALTLAPVAASSYQDDSSEIHWSLSFPNTTGKISVDISEIPDFLRKGQKTSEVTKGTDEGQDFLRKGRTPSLAQRMLSQLETFVSQHANTSLEPISQEKRQIVDRVFLTAGDICELSGKLMTSDSKLFLDSPRLAFLDSVNKSEMHFNTSSLVVDLNPHHTTHILNLIRNYSSGGTHTISSQEKGRADESRKAIATRVLGEGRLPNLSECLTSGLSMGPMMNSAASRNAEDDVFELLLRIDSFLMRIYDLPNSISPFSTASHRVCSLECQNFEGTLRSNRLTSELICQPDKTNDCISIYSGYLSSASASVKATDALHSKKLGLPKALLTNFRISKKTNANPSWGVYNSNLFINVNELRGCLLDYTVRCIAKFANSSIPHPLHEDLSALACILSVDSIHVELQRGSVFILSPASSSAVQRSGQRSSSAVGRRERSTSEHTMQATGPTFIKAITFVRFSEGLRIVTSSLATERFASRCRLLLPEMTIDLLTPWGDKLAPWVDEATMKAQVSHASALGTEHSPNLFERSGVMRKVGEFRRVSLDILLESAPSIWSSNVSSLQKGHVISLFEKIGHCAPQWAMCGVPSPCVRALNEMEDMGTDEQWWCFLSKARKASIMGTYLTEAQDVRKESMSVCLYNSLDVSLSPECLEVANDIIIRMHERLLYHKKNSRISEKNQSMILNIDEILDLWERYEATEHHQTASFPLSDHLAWSVRAFESKPLKLKLLPPSATDLGDVEGFSNVRASGSSLVVSFPFGLHFMHSTEWGIEPGQSTKAIDSLRSASSHTPSDKVFKKKIWHVSIPVVSILCQWYSLDTTEVGLLKDLIVILRERVCVRNQDHSSQNNLWDRQGVERRVLVGKLSSLQLGSGGSSLSMYSAFGKVVSVFMLLMRTLALGLTSLTKLRIEVMENVCERLVSTPIHVFFEQGCSNVYAVFTEAEQIITKQRKPQESRIKLLHPEETKPFGMGSENMRDISQTRSIDFSLRNVSVRLSGHEMLHINVFLCRSRSCAAASKSGEHSDETVVKAAFGVTTIFMTDSIAADALRVVSEVASFVGKTTRLFPMLKQDTEEQEDAKGRSFTVSSSVADNGEGVDGVLLSSTRSPSEYYKTFRQDRRRAESDRTVKPISSAYPYPIRSTSKPSRWSVGQSKRKTMSLDKVLDSSDSAPGVLRRMRSTASPTFRSPNRMGSQHFGLFDKPMNSLRLAQSRSAKERVAHFLSDISTNASETPEQKHFDHIEMKDYQVVAVTTAGETGPPRKRAKRMVPKTIVPPAFRTPLKGTGGHLRQRDLPSTAAREELRRVSFADREGREQAVKSKNGRRSHVIRHGGHGKRLSLVSKPKPLIFPKTFPTVTMFLSFKKVEMQYFRGRGLSRKKQVRTNDLKDTGVLFVINQPRLTLMSSANGMCSVVLTASSSEVRSSNDPNCVLAGAISRFGMTASVAQGPFPQSLPKLIMSTRISKFVATLHARDLQAVLKFREDFKEDLKGVLAAFVTTKHSISEMARATRLMTSASVGRKALFSTLAVDLLFEDSKVVLKGFHPKDTSMSITYMLDGLFFSAVASEADSAALLLGLRLYGHGLRLAATAWDSAEVLRFPSLDARGVQWGESIGLPTFLKVTAEPLRNSTSVQGLRHILFTVSGLMAFQNLPENTTEQHVPESVHQRNPCPESSSESSVDEVAGAPLTRSFAAWERTKGVRMELSIRPMSLSLVSGPAVALFHVQAVTGVFEWNKLVTKGVQLRTSIGVPGISLSFLRMPSTQFTVQEIKPDDGRTSLSVALEKSRVDILKSQEDLLHTFVFRIEVYAVSGKLHPWRLLRDAAAWADEQEFVSDLQQINYSNLSTSRQRHAKTSPVLNPTEHRMILVGFSIQRFRLAVPLLSSEEYSSSRLALSATNLHVFARQRFQNPEVSIRNVIEVKTNFVGVFWDNGSLLSSNHARIVLAINHHSRDGLSLFGPTSVVITPGTWMFCPRKDFIAAITEAKTVKEYRNLSEKTKEMLARPESVSLLEGTSGADSTSNFTEKHDRLLVESLRLKITRTSGFIEGLSESLNFSYPNESSSRESHLMSKLSIPAFSVAVSREVDHDFDLVDVDFSQREGQFPRRCLQRVSRLFADLFGAVAGQNEVSYPHLYQQQQGRKISRDISVLVRFGESMYRAQEEAKLPFESRFGFFAGKHSALLLSVSTDPVFGHEETHTTVYTGLFPHLKLEITPMLDGARPQSLRLANFRLLHGTSPNFPPHSLFHISRVTAVMEIKTLLLVERRVQIREYPKPPIAMSEDHFNSLVPHSENTERSIIVFLGTPKIDQTIGPGEREESMSRIHAGLQKAEPAALQKRHRAREGTDTSSFGENAASYDKKDDPDIRVQLQLTPAPDARINQMDIFVSRLLFGISRFDETEKHSSFPTLGSYVLLQEGIVRAQWDFLKCQLSLKENMSYVVTSKGLAEVINFACVGNIMNRFNLEVFRYDVHTLRLCIDAVAMGCVELPYAVSFESTDIRTEVSHTLLQAVARLLGLVKKLKNEVTLLSERDTAKESKSGQQQEAKVLVSTAIHGSIQGEKSLNNRDETQSEGSAKLSSQALARVLRASSERLFLPSDTTVLVKGNSLALVLRGYQFDERQHNAEIWLSAYDLHHQYLTKMGDEPITRKTTSLNLGMMTLSYRDDERGSSSDICKVPSPALVLHIQETPHSLFVELSGNLDVKLGSGFYNWRNFRDLAALTIQGVEVSNSQDSIPYAEDRSPTPEPDFWNGRIPEVTVNVNPRIDVIGDFTSDVLFRMRDRLGHGELIPGYMYHHMVLPLEALVNLLMDTLVRHVV